MTANRTPAFPVAWRPLVALLFVVLSIGALIAVPWFGARRTRPLYDQLTDVVAPARGQLTGINYSLAIEGVLLREYFVSRDESVLARYRTAYERERGASERLAASIDSAGPIARRAFDDFSIAMRNWHARIDRLLETRNPTVDQQRWETEYSLLFESLARLDQALEAAGDARRVEIDRLEHGQEMLALVLGALAMAAALAVGWLAHELRNYAGQLARRTDELERATESRARLMRGVTHDLKNPLHVIDGFASLLEEGVQGPLTPGQLDGVRRLRKSAREMLALINDLLELARAESGQLRITPTRVDVARLCRDVALEYAPVADAAGLALQHRIEHNELHVLTDQTRVRQVIENLISNALKYTPEGGTVCITAESIVPTEDTDAGKVAIKVSDTGHGVPEDQRTRIFSDFTRLEEHAQLPGAGLGLSISRRIAGLLGGDLTLESEVGKGSTFTLWLPRDGAPSARPSASSHS